MSKTLRWVFLLLPCVPGLTLLAAAGVVLAVSFKNPDWDQSEAWRAEQLAMAGGAVLLAGLMIGAFVSWRIAHPRPDDEDDSEQTSTK